MIARCSATQIRREASALTWTFCKTIRIVLKTAPMAQFHGGSDISSVTVRSTDLRSKQEYIIYSGFEGCTFFFSAEIGPGEILKSQAEVSLFPESSD